MPTKNNDAKRVTRGMPNNTEAEASVLGAILIDNGVADNLIPQLTEDDFYLDKNRIIFSVMKELQFKNVPIDALTVTDALEVQGKLKDVGSVEYITSLAENLLSSANSEYYFNIVKRDSLIRRVIRAGNSIVQVGYESDDSRAALDNAERMVYELSEANDEKALVKADDAFAAAMNAIQNAQLGNLPKNIIYTGFPTLDKYTKGFKPGELVLVAARPSVGKTAFALNIAAKVAVQDKKTVAIFSLEMQSSLLAKRMLAYQSKISYEDMDSMGGLSVGDKSNRLMSAYKKLAAANIYIDDFSMNTPMDVLSKCRRLKRTKGLDLVIIDYLQLMSNPLKSADGRQVEVSDMSRKMKLYAKELDCPILLLSQMSRDVDKRDGHTPVLSDLRESGAIEQDADIVMFLHNPSKYDKTLPENRIELSLQKNRNGRTSSIELEWSGETTTFAEVTSSGETKQQRTEAEVPRAKANYVPADVPPPDDAPPETESVVESQADVPPSQNDEKSENALDKLDLTGLKEVASDVNMFDSDDGDIPF